MLSIVQRTELKELCHVLGVVHPKVCKLLCVIRVNLKHPYFSKIIVISVVFVYLSKLLFSG